MRASAVSLVVLVALTMAAYAVEEHPDRQYWNLQEVCSLDSADYWTGPFDPADLTVSTDAVQGEGCIEARLDVLPGHFVRIEKNFVAIAMMVFRI